MNYTILKSDHTDRLTKAVMHFIERGWKPQGGVAMVWDVNDAMYLQAMINEEERAEKFVSNLVGNRKTNECSHVWLGNTTVGTQTCQLCGISIISAPIIPEVVC